MKISVTETCENLFIDKMLVHSVKSADSAINEAMCFRKPVYHKNSEQQGLEENAVHLEYVPILNYDVFRKLVNLILVLKFYHFLVILQFCCRTADRFYGMSSVKHLEETLLSKP